MGDTKSKASLFELDGIPSFSRAFPLALQHVVAMIVGCVTPAIIISGVAGLAPAVKVILIQSALVVSALSTFPAWVTTIFGKSPVVIATLVAVLLNIILPKDQRKAQSS